MATVTTTTLTTTVSTTNVSLKSFETVNKLESFAQPLVPILEKLVHIGAEYYNRVKTYSPQTSQACQYVEHFVLNTSEQVGHKVQEKLNENVTTLEAFDKSGLQLLNKVETGKQKMEKVLLVPALFLLSVLNHFYFLLKPSTLNTEETVSTCTDNSPTNEVFESQNTTEESQLAETYKTVGRRTLEVGSEVVNLSVNTLQTLRQALLNRFPQLTQYEDKIRSLLANPQLFYSILSSVSTKPQSVQSAQHVEVQSQEQNHEKNE